MSLNPAQSDHVAPFRSNSMSHDSQQSAPAVLAHHVRLGILCIFGGVSALTLQDALIKWLSGTFPLHEITLARSVVAVVITLIIVHFEGGFGLLRTNRPVLHLARSVLLITANMCFFMGVASMPLAEATAVFFLAPLFITALSVPLLGEEVGLRRWIAVLVGMAGMIVMLRPGQGTIELVALFPVGAALAYALMQIVTRRLGATDRASSMALYVHVAFAIVSAGVGLSIGDGRLAGSDHPSIDFLFRAWSMPEGLEIVLLLGCGVLIAIGAYLLSQAYRVAPPAIVAPFEYAALPLALFWGIMLWGDWPDVSAMAGMALIVGSGLYVFYRETMRGRQISIRRILPRNR
tara:strand:- start:1443 stop:2486 length:1044 start_codon:yes stop_codon:yes gene_type:complete